MRFFRSTWLQRILPFLLVLLLGAAPLSAIEQQGSEADELVIQAPQFHDELSSSIRQLKIKYGFDVVYVSVVPIFRQILSDDYIPGTSFDPLSADLLNYPDRGPPRLPAML